jgi:putative tryptophan/tyrosine transport system substrate-binding protein
MRRRDFTAGFAGAVAWPLAARAQQAERVRLIGVLTAGSLNGPIAHAAIREELTKLGWVEGRTLRIDFRAPGADPRGLAADAEALVNLRPDVIIALTGAAARAAQGRTQTIPIVFVGAGDPLENNLVGGIARPAGNTTGFANNFTSLGGKWVELLKQAAPRLTKVASVFDPELTFRGGRGGIRDAIGTASAQLALTTISMPVRNPDEIARAINAFAAEPNGGLLITGAHPDENIKSILGLALQHRLPTMFGAGKLVAEGLLMSNGPDLIDLTRRATSYVDRILRGAKPSELPVQFPTRFPLVLNLKTARAIGLDIPPTVLALADEVIE